VGRKGLIVGGMLIQGAALIVMVLVEGLGPWLATGAALGLGTAMVYPTLLAAIGDVAHPSSRGKAFGIYRFWRDSGYVVGALLAGALADGFGMRAAIGAVGVLTLASGIMASVGMPETLPRPATRTSPERA
jgi:MFS family permease